MNSTIQYYNLFVIDKQTMCKNKVKHTCANSSLIFAYFFSHITKCQVNIDFKEANTLFDNKKICILSKIKNSQTAIYAHEKKDKYAEKNVCKFYKSNTDC